MTLEADCKVSYKCSNLYAPNHDGGIRWDSIGIDWPIAAGTIPELSLKDTRLPALGEFTSPFPYYGRQLQPLA